MYMSVCTYVCVFWFFFSKPMFPRFWELSEKGPRPKWIIYKHESGKNKKCLSVNNFGFLSVASRRHLQPIE